MTEQNNAPPEATPNVDVQLLEQTGANVILASLVEELLRQKPADPISFFHQRIQQEIFHFNPSHIHVLLQNAKTISPKLLLKALIDVSPPNFIFQSNYFAPFHTDLLTVAADKFSTDVDEQFVMQLDSSVYPAFAGAVIQSAQGRIALQRLSQELLLASNSDGQQENAGTVNNDPPQTLSSTDTKTTVKSLPFHLVFMLPLPSPTDLVDCFPAFVASIQWLLEPISQATFDVVFVPENSIPTGERDASNTTSTCFPKASDVAKKLASQLGLQHHVHVVECSHEGSENFSLGLQFILSRVPGLIEVETSQAGADPQGAADATTKKGRSAIVVLSSLAPYYHVGTLGRAIANVCHTDLSTGSGVEKESTLSGTMTMGKNTQASKTGKTTQDKTTTDALSVTVGGQLNLIDQFIQLVVSTNFNLSFQEQISTEESLFLAYAAHAVPTMSRLAHFPEGLFPLATIVRLESLPAQGVSAFHGAYLANTSSSSVRLTYQDRQRPSTHRFLPSVLLQFAFLCAENIKCLPVMDHVFVTWRNHVEANEGEVYTLQAAPSSSDGKKGRDSTPSNDFAFSQSLVSLASYTSFGLLKAESDFDVTKCCETLIQQFSKGAGVKKWNAKIQDFESYVLPKLKQKNEAEKESFSDFLEKFKKNMPRLASGSKI